MYISIIEMANVNSNESCVFFTYCSEKSLKRNFWSKNIYRIDLSLFKVSIEHVFFLFVKHLFLEKKANFIIENENETKEKLVPKSRKIYKNSTTKLKIDDFSIQSFEKKKNN